MLVAVLPARSVTWAVSALLPLLSVTLLLQLPLLWTTALPIALAPSRMVTVAPASATSTAPVMVWLAWLVGPPVLVIATVGAVVSSVTLSAAVVEGLPARSLHCAQPDFRPSEPRSPAGTA